MIRTEFLFCPKGGAALRESFYAHCIRTGKQRLLSQWLREENLPLTPAELSYGSRKKVWWQCERGHRWQAAVYARTEGAGCPVCAGRVPAPGARSLASCSPDLARQWHPARNGALTPEQVSPGSHRSVWWQCEKGHEWRAAVRSRAAGSGCPVCANRKVQPRENDLATRYPALAAQWHPARNGALTPERVTPASNRKVWWLCPRGHAYQAAVASRTAQGSGCPYCAGRKVLPGFNDLATAEPKIAAQWHPTLNGALTPELVTAGSRRKVWWICPEGHVWKAAVYARAGRQRSGCPVCAGTVRRRRAPVPQRNDQIAGHRV